MFGTKQLYEATVPIINWFLNKLKWDLNQNKAIFIQENEIENVVCKIVVIYVRLSG